MPVLKKNFFQEAQDNHKFKWLSHSTSCETTSN